MAYINTEDFYNELIANKLDMFAGVPDSLLKSFCACVIKNTPKGHNIITANEGNAVGIACGYHIATGKSSVVYMQNSGEGNIVNPLLSIADPDVYSIPMLLIIGWRGEPGINDEPQHVKQGKVTCKLLDAMHVPYEILDDNWKEKLRCIVGIMHEEKCPVALVIHKGSFTDYTLSVDASDAPLSREEALEVVLDHVSEDEFVVSTTGKTSREVFEIRELRGQSHERDFLTVGGMGHASSIAFGMTLGSERNVYCVDGDGSFLMHMGAFPIIGQNAPTNFKYILNNNGAHESVGGQPTVGQKIDVPAILKASGFEGVFEAKTAGEIAKGMENLKNGAKRALVITTHPGARADLGRPTMTPQENKAAMMAKFENLR